MPLVDVTVVDLEAVLRSAGVEAQQLADALGDALGVAAGRVWLRLHDLAPARYAENRSAREGLGPVFVSVLHAQPPDGAAREAEVTLLTGVVAHLLRLDADRVHIEYAPAGAGRVAFGGLLVPER
jgi:hypothetical protein